MQMNLGSYSEGERGVGQQHNAQFSDSKYDALPSSPVDWTLKNGREGDLSPVLVHRIKFWLHSWYLLYYFIVQVVNAALGIKK